MTFFSSLTIHNLFKIDLWSSSLQINSRHSQEKVIFFTVLTLSFSATWFKGPDCVSLLSSPCLYAAPRIVAWIQALAYCSVLGVIYRRPQRPQRRLSLDQGCALAQLVGIDTPMYVFCSCRHFLHELNLTVGERERWFADPELWDHIPDLLSWAMKRCSACLVPSEPRASWFICSFSRSLKLWYSRDYRMDLTKVRILLWVLEVFDNVLHTLASIAWRIFTYYFQYFMTEIQRTSVPIVAFQWRTLKSSKSSRAESLCVLILSVGWNLKSHVASLISDASYTPWAYLIKHVMGLS